MYKRQDIHSLVAAAVQPMHSSNQYSFTVLCVNPWSIMFISVQVMTNKIMELDSATPIRYKAHGGIRLNVLSSAGYVRYCALNCWTACPVRFTVNEKAQMKVRLFPGAMHVPQHGQWAPDEVTAGSEVVQSKDSEWSMCFYQLILFSRDHHHIEEGFNITIGRF